MRRRTVAAWGTIALLGGAASALLWPTSRPEESRVAARASAPAAEVPASGNSSAPAARAAVAAAGRAGPARMESVAGPGPLPASRGAEQKREREQMREWARTDPASFAEEARGRIRAPGAAEDKLELLKAARAAGPAVVAELSAALLEPDGDAPPAVRGIALNTLVRRAGEDAAARGYLHAISIDGRVPADERRRAARAWIASALERDLDRLVAEAERSRDELVWHESLRGLASHPSPRAAALLAELARTRSWDPTAQAIAAGPALVAPEDTFGE